MKRKIFSILLTLVLVCSFSLVTAVPAGADYAAFDNPDYYYAVVKVAPDGTKYASAGLSPDGTQIVAQMRWYDPDYRSEVVLMNADGSDEITISGDDSGTGDIPSYGPPFWSDDGTAIGFVERHTANPNKVISYDVASGTRTYIYEPTSGEAGYGVCNPDFLGSSTTSIVFWDLVEGKADLFIWDGTTRTNITNSPEYKEYEPVSNADGTVIVYWSGEMFDPATEPINTTHTLTESDGTWTKDVDFTPIPGTYWAFWSGRADNYIGLTIHSTKDVAIYDSTGVFVMDLTGEGYSGGDGQWNFFGSGFEGPNGEFVMTSSAGRTDPAVSRDIVFAAPRTALFVDDDGSDSNPGTEAAPFATVQKAIDEAAPDGTINVAAGTYAEPQLSINKSLTIQGADQDDVIIQRDSGNSYFLSVSGAIDFTMKDLTIDVSGSTTTNFVAHISGLTSATFENVTVIGQGKDHTTDGQPYSYVDPTNNNIVGGLDLINVTSTSLTNVTVRDVSRNGFSFTNVNSITLKDFTASNCGHTDSAGWAGLALYRDDGGASNLKLSRDGINSISNAPIGVNAHIISGTVMLSVYGPDNLSISGVLVPVVAPNTSNSDTFALKVIPSAPYKVYATDGPSLGFASYFFTNDDAIAAALDAFTLFAFEHVVYDLATPKFIVGAGMSIQTAIDAASDGDTITVAAGMYEEEVTIKDKSLTLLGAQADEPIVNGERAGDESVIRGKGTGTSYGQYSWCVVRIEHSDVVINGFTIENGQRGIVLQPLGEGISDILISYNYIKDTGTSGSNSGVFRNSAVANVTIDHNYIASNPNGIKTNGGGTTITDNTFCDNGHGIDFQGGDPYSVYFPDYDQPKYPTLISGNTFTDDSTSIYLRLDKCHQSITITGNDITGAHNDAIRTWNVYDEGYIGYDGIVVTLVNPAIHYNNIVGSTNFGINNQVTEINEINLNAKYNWWGEIGGPGGEGLGNGDNVTANVDYDPWLTKNQADTVREGIAYFGSTIPLEAGWNTLSVPLKLKDSANTLAKIMDLGDFLTNENVRIVYQYTGSKWVDIGASATKLVPLRGYYIEILGTDTVDFPVLYSGELGLPTLDMSKGWNLIGSGFGINKTDYGIAATDNDTDSQKEVATALYSIKDECSVVVSPSTQGQKAAWGTTVIDDNKFMIVGEAYWVFMTSSTYTLAGFEVTPIYYLP